MLDNAERAHARRRSKYHSSKYHSSKYRVRSSYHSTFLNAHIKSTYPVLVVSVWTECSVRYCSTYAPIRSLRYLRSVEGRGVTGFSAASWGIMSGFVSINNKGISCDKVQTNCIHFYFLNPEFAHFD